MRWPARHLQELQPIIHGIAWAPMLQCGRSQTLFVLAKSIGSLSVNRIILSKVAASDLVLQCVEALRMGRHVLPANGTPRCRRRAVLTATAVPTKWSSAPG